MKKEVAAANGALFADAFAPTFSWSASSDEQVTTDGENNTKTVRSSASPKPSGATAATSTSTPEAPNTSGSAPAKKSPCPPRPPRANPGSATPAAGAKTAALAPYATYPWQALGLITKITPFQD